MRVSLYHSHTHTHTQSVLQFRMLNPLEGVIYDYHSISEKEETHTFHSHTHTQQIQMDDGTEA